MRLRNIVTLSIVSVLLFTMQVFANGLSLNISGRNISLADAAPYLDDNRTLTPIRVVSESLGFKVNWDEKTKNFTVEGKDIRDNKSVVITGQMNKPQVTILKDGKTTKKNIDDSPKVVVKMKNNRLYVPLRFFAENFGYTVFYDAGSRTVFITKPGDPAPEIPEPDKKQDVVWNGNVKDFVNKVVENTDMTLAEGKISNISQAHLGVNGSQVIVGPPLFDSGANVKIVVNGWNISGRFYPDFIKAENQENMDNVEKVIQMYTSDKTAFSKINNAIQNGKSHTTKNPIKTSDGKQLTVKPESSGTVIRFY